MKIINLPSFFVLPCAFKRKLILALQYRDSELNELNHFTLKVASHHRLAHCLFEFSLVQSVSH